MHVSYNEHNTSNTKHQKQNQMPLWRNAMYSAGSSASRGDAETGDSPVPAWFNWHRYRAQDRFPTPNDARRDVARSSAQQQAAHLLPGGPGTPRTSNNNNNNNNNSSSNSASLSTRPGAPREVSDRMPIFDASYERAIGGGGGSAGGTTPAQRMMYARSGGQPAADQEEWAQRLPVSSSAAHMPFARMETGAPTAASYADPTAYSRAAAQGAAVPSHQSFLQDESRRMAAASLLPGDRAQRQQQQQQQTALPWVPRPAEQMPGVPPKSRYELDHNAIEFDRQKREADGSSDFLGQLGVREFTVSVVTDPRRLGTASPDDELEKLPAHVVSDGSKKAVVLQSVRAKSLRGFAEAVEAALETHGVYMSITGFRFSNLMQTSEWVNVESLVGDEILRADRTQGLTGGGKDSYHAKALFSDDDGHADGTRNKAKKSDQVFDAVAAAAALAAGSIPFSRLPSELSIVPFIGKRRLAFGVTCTTLSPAGVGVFPLKEEDIVLERRGSAWVSDMAQLRAAVARVTHRDCATAPLFFVSASSQVDADLGYLPQCEPIISPHQLPPFSCILVALPPHIIKNGSGGRVIMMGGTASSPASGKQPPASSAFALPDETGPVAVAVSKRIKTPLAAGLVTDPSTLDLTGVPPKREEILTPDKQENFIGAPFGPSSANASGGGGAAGGNMSEAERAKLRDELLQPPVRVSMNLIEQVKAEGMARFGKYIEQGAIRTPNIYRPAPEDDAERSTVDESSRALLFSTDPSADRANVRQYEVPKSRFRRALLQASMHYLRESQDQDVLSADALVRATSDMVDVVMKQVEGTYGVGDVRPYMLPLGSNELELVKAAALKAVQLEIAVRVGRNDGGAPFITSPETLRRVNAERRQMGLPPLDTRAADVPPEFFEMTSGSPTHNALLRARAAEKKQQLVEEEEQRRQQRLHGKKAGAAESEAEVAHKLGLPAYEPPPPRKPLSQAVLVLTKPQFDLLTKRIVFFATCSVDVFSVASAISAMRFHRRSANELQSTSEAAYFRWAFAYGQVTSDTFHKYLRAKDAGTVNHGIKQLREVPLDALIELGLARVDIVSFSRPTTLALEVTLRRPPTDRQAAADKEAEAEAAAAAALGGGGEDDATAARKRRALGDRTEDVLQADERYSVYLEVGDDDGGVVHQALTFILPTSVLHPEDYANEMRRKSDLRRHGKSVPSFEEVDKAMPGE